MIDRLVYIEVTPRLLLGAIVFAITLFPALIFEYELNFIGLLAAHFFAALCVLSRGSGEFAPPNLAPVSNPTLFRLAVLYAAFYLMWKYFNLVMTRELGGNQVEAAISGESSGSAAAYLTSSFYIVMLGVLAGSKKSYLFQVFLILDIVGMVILGSHRSPIILMIIASYFHYRSKSNIFFLIILGVMVLVSLTVLNFLRQGLSVGALIDLGTFVRGVFVANNFHDYWSAGLDISRFELIKRIPLLFVPSAIYPEKGVVSFSHIMTEFTYGYSPIDSLSPIITFGFVAEAWIYLGWLSFLLTGFAVFLYLRLIRSALFISRFLGYYVSLQFVMIYRSGVDAFLFNSVLMAITLASVGFIRRMRVR
jgi:hypothetical protein